jgi:iron complex transport system permease protein
MSVRRNNKFVIPIFIVIILLLFIVSLSMGRYPIKYMDVLKAIISKFNSNILVDDTILLIIHKVRLPRVLASVLVGSALSVSGACYQGMFRNPMVSPSLLGVSSGAGFGAALGIWLSLNFIGIQSTSFLFGMLAVFSTYFISFVLARKRDITLTLVLTGTVISSLFSSLIAFLKFVGDPYEDLPAITFWLMGSLSDVSMNDVKIIAVIVTIGIVILYSIRWKINILSFGEKEAASLGIETGRLRIVIILCSTLITAAAVSISGLIGWVGLVVPHLARMIVGPDYKYLLPASALLGGIYMLTIDDLSRTLFAAEIPLSILTSIIGMPFFIYLLAKGKKGWV